MKKILTSVLAVLAISTNAFADPGDADALAGLILGIGGLILSVIGIVMAGYIVVGILYFCAIILSYLVIALAAVINTVILPVVFLVNKVFGKFHRYFYFTRMVKTGIYNVWGW